ncbi:MAG: FtsQ-type POTRA domain-containing protein [Elainellaceae cyanobacterium]
MPHITTISHSKLTRRRRQLRWRRRWRVLRLFWRLLLVGSFTGGLVWLISQPGWVIRDVEQISVDGVEFLSEDTVRDLMPLSYPTSILDVQPQAIARELKASGPIAQVIVSRRLFPPSLAVHITERHPVAVLIGNSYIGSSRTHSSDLTEPATPQTARAIPLQLAPTGLIDRNGIWMPLESYLNIEQDLDLPQLRLVGMQERYQTYWTVLYQAIQKSPVQVYEIDWRDPANLIINSELGVIHLGSYAPDKFVNQLATLDRMRNLPDVIDISTVEYIDIHDPQSPTLQFNPGTPYYGQTSTPLLPALEWPRNSQEDGVDDADINDADINDADVNDADINGDDTRTLDESEPTDSDDRF